MTISRTTCLIVALAGLSFPALASDHVTDFEQGANPAGFHFREGADVIEPSGGTPGAYLRQDFYFQFAPMLKTDPTISSEYHGDLRAKGVSRISFDARVDHKDFGTGLGFPMSILLRDTKGTPHDATDDDYTYTVGKNIPLVGEGWVHYDFDIPSQDTSPVPAGWHGGSYLDGEVFRPGVDFNDVITNVDKVEIWFIHPAWFAFLDAWDVSVDSITLSTDTASAIVDLGGALFGTVGEPQLNGVGDLTPGSDADFNLSFALPGAPTYVVTSLTELNAPFKGGVLVPKPDAGLVTLADGAGQVDLRLHVPAGMPSQLDMYLQAIVMDGAAPAGFALSNALKATTP
jgi:hypothetical protein